MIRPGPTDASHESVRITDIVRYLVVILLCDNGQTWACLQTFATMASVNVTKMVEWTRDRDGDQDAPDRD